MSAMTTDRQAAAARTRDWFASHYDPALFARWPELEGDILLLAAERPGWSVTPPAGPGWWRWRRSPVSNVQVVWLFGNGDHLRARLMGVGKPVDVTGLGGEWAGRVEFPE